MTAIDAPPRDVVLPVPVRRQLRTDALARWVAGLLLLTGAWLKWHAGVTYADFGGWQSWHKPLTVGIVTFELALGLALLTGIAARTTKWVAIATFTVFAGYTLYRWLGGYGSCGCFGTVRVDPRVTLAVDLGVVAMLLLSRTPATQPGEPQVVKRVAIAWLVLTLPAGLTLAGSSPASLTDAADADYDKPIRLEPRDWVGRPLPITPYLSATPADFTRGRWLVVVWHDGCGHCWNRLPSFVERLDTDPTIRGLVVVRTVEPRDPNATRQRLEESVGKHPRLHEASLDPTRRWSAATPTVIQVEDRVVIGN